MSKHAKHKCGKGRFSRRIKPPIIIGSIGALLLLAVFFPLGFIMLICGALLALLLLYFFSWWR